MAPLVVSVRECLPAGNSHSLSQVSLSSVAARAQSYHNRREEGACVVVSIPILYCICTVHTYPAICFGCRKDTGANIGNLDPSHVFAYVRVRPRSAAHVSSQSTHSCTHGEA